MSKLDETKMNIRKIIPHLWFEDNAEEAAKFYTSIFKNSRIQDITHYGESAAEVSGRPKGTVTQLALNGGPIFKFSPAISFLVSCETQREIDIFWQKLSEGGGEQEQCGWLKDKFGVSWQIVPSILAEMIDDKDANKTERVIKAMLHMKKLDIQGLKKAFEEVDRRS